MNRGEIAVLFFNGAFNPFMMAGKDDGRKQDK
jgi:hypothetical protein